MRRHPRAVLVCCALPAVFGAALSAHTDMAVGGPVTLTLVDSGNEGSPAAAIAEDAPILDFQFTDLDGATEWLSDQRGARAFVIVMRDVGCPVSARYAPKVARMSKSYSDRGVAFLYVNVNPSNTVEQIRAAELEQHGLTGRYIHDPKARIGKVLGARSTGEVFVLDGNRRLRYRGPVDDQYGVTFTRPRVQHEHLQAALAAVLAGKAPPAADVAAEGCLLGLEQQAIHTGPVTYHDQVSRIVQNNCQTCHRSGGIAPFPLEKYADVHARRVMIARMVKDRRMPPWFAHRDVGEFANDRSLSDADLLTLLRWIDEGAPAGDASRTPPRRTWATAWQIGEPDAVVKMEEAFAVPAEGVVDYQYFYVKTDFPEDRWITAMEMRPGAKQQVHHALVFIEEPGRKMRDRQPGDPVFQGGTAGFFAAYAPGGNGNVFPTGTAKLLPKGAWLKFQMHYTTNGVAAEDRTEIGLVFAKEPPKAEVQTWTAINTRFEIPPGAPNHEVVAERTFRTAGTLLSLFPHMHIRGKAFRMELVSPAGTVRPLLEVPRYDFSWQLAYTLKEPIRVEPGMKLRATGWYDNSELNPFNPDPTKAVRHGPQSWDEMMIGYFDWVPDTSATPAPPSPGGSTRP